MTYDEYERLRRDLYNDLRDRITRRDQRRRERRMRSLFRRVVAIWVLAAVISAASIALVLLRAYR